MLQNALLKYTENNKMKRVINNNISTELKRIARELSEEDRLEAALAMPCSYQTVLRYLQGSVKKEPFGKKLLAFFQKRIANRENETV